MGSRTGMFLFVWGERVGARGGGSEIKGSVAFPEASLCFLKVPEEWVLR